MFLLLAPKFSMFDLKQFNVGYLVIFMKQVDEDKRQFFVLVSYLRQLINIPNAKTYLDH